MALYMAQFAYTAEALAAMAKNPQDRSIPSRELIEKSGGLTLVILSVSSMKPPTTLLPQPALDTSKHLIQPGCSPLRRRWRRCEKLEASRSRDQLQHKLASSLRATDEVWIPLLKFRLLCVRD